MKLSERMQQLERAYAELQQELRLWQNQNHVHFNYTPRRPNHILPRDRHFSPENQ